LICPAFQEICCGSKRGAKPTPTSPTSRRSDPCQRPWCGCGSCLLLNFLSRVYCLTTYTTIQVLADSLT
jgi:hypothetical protein